MNYVTAGGQYLAFVLPTDPQTRRDLPVVANARVMAAGSTLLDACRWAAAHLEVLIESGGGGEGGDEALFHLNDAIAAAILPGTEEELPNQEELPNSGNSAIASDSATEK